MVTIPTDWITYINLGVIAFYIVLMIAGAVRGFLRQVTALTGTIVSFFAAWRYYDVTAKFLQVWPRDWTPLQGTLLKEQVYRFANQACWFILIFFVCRVIFILVERLFEKIESAPVIQEISGLLGGALGAVNATVWILVFATILTTPFFSNGKRIADTTWIGLIDEKVTAAAYDAGISLTTNDMINLIYEEAGRLDDSDREAVAEWLSAQGFEDLYAGKE